MIIAGYKPTKFKSKTDDSMVVGFSVYTVAEFRENGVGCFTDKFFLSESKFKEMEIEKHYRNKSDVEFMYNKYGKVTSCIALN